MNKPKPEYGEFAGKEPGKYDGVITQVISLGHQYRNGKTNSKVYIAIEFPEMGGDVVAVNNFGLYKWLSKNEYPYVGLHEIIAAVLNNPVPTSGELKAFDVYQLIGQPITATFESVGGYVNMVNFEHCAKIIAAKNPMIVFGTEHIAEEHLVSALPEKVQKMVRESVEYQDGTTDGPAYDPIHDQPDVNPEDVPF